MNINPHTLSYPATAQMTNERNPSTEVNVTGNYANAFSNDIDKTVFSVAAMEASEKNKREGGEKAKDNEVNKASVDEEELSEPEKLELKNLKARDIEVKQHEQAHLQVAGQYATSGASYTWQEGPDGKKYAVGGEVSIDTAEVVGDPEATIAKMDQVKKAALAPTSPSAQDYRVVAKAEQKANQARSELSDTSIETQKDKMNTDSALAFNSVQHKMSAYNQIQSPAPPELSIAA